MDLISRFRPQHCIAYENGFPFLYLTGCISWKWGGGADVGPLNREVGTEVSELPPDSQRYFDVHHTTNDIFENVHKLELGALNMTALV